MPVSALVEARRERGATRLATGAGPAEQLVFPVEAHMERSCERNDLTLMALPPTAGSTLSAYP
jgi:hypothetical protein